MPSIYVGPASCYARYEGIYVPGDGVKDVATAAALIELILRDSRRGWTYNHRCRRIKMTPFLARSRIKYIYALAVKHGAPPHELERIRELVDYAAEHLRLPPWAEAVAKPLARTRPIAALAATVKS